MKAVIREAQYALEPKDIDRAHDFSLKMQTFCNGILSHIAENYDGKVRRPRVHVIWANVRSEPWAQKITMAWALYSISDMIRMSAHYTRGDRLTVSRDFGWVISTKTFRVGNPSRLVLPRPSIYLDGFSPFEKGDFWTGSGRVSVLEHGLQFSFEVLCE